MPPPFACETAKDAPPAKIDADIEARSEKGKEGVSCNTGKSFQSERWPLSSTHPHNTQNNVDRTFRAMCDVESAGRLCEWHAEISTMADSRGGCYMSCARHPPR